MKFRLRSLFVLTLVVALIIAAISNDRRAMSQVEQMRGIVESTLSDVECLYPECIDREEFRNEFILFSSGNLNWDIEQNNQDVARIKVTWQSRLLSPKNPTITLHPYETDYGRAFTEEFLRLTESKDVEINVETKGDF